MPLPTPVPTPLAPSDPGDPVTRTIAAMHQDGTLADSHPAAQSIPAESLVSTLMHNFTNNTRAWGGHGIGGQAMGALLDLMEAAQNGLYTAMGTNQDEMKQAFRNLAPVIPAPSTTQILGGLWGVQNYTQQVLATGDTGRRWSPETLEIAGSLLTDPTTYFGVGLFKGLAKGAVKVGAPKIVAKGLEVAAAGDAALSDAMGKAAEQAIRFIQVAGLGVPNKALGAMFPELPKWTAYAKADAAMGDALQWLEHKGWNLPALRSIVARGSVGDVLDELPTALRPQIDPSHLERILTPTRTNPNDDIAVAREQYQRWLRRDMGLDDPRTFLSWYTKLTDWWKSQALASLNYPIQNLLGGAVQGQMAGVSLPKTLAEAADHLDDIAAGRAFTTSGARDLSNATGLPVPSSLHGMADAALNANAGAAAAPNALRDSIALGVLGGVGAGPVGAAVGAAIGSRIGAVSNRVRKASQGIETVLRERGWEEGMSRALVDALGDMESLVVRALTDPRANRTGQAAAQNVIDTARQLIRDSNGQVSVDQVVKHLTGAGVTRDALDDVARELDDILYSASQRGVKLSNAFNFDYQDLSNVERALTTAFPFSTWLLKAAPFYAEQAARHPLIGNIVRAERGASGETQERRGLTSRFTGTLPAQLGSSILSAIVGRPVEMWSDPLRMFLPFTSTAQRLQQMQFRDPEDTNPVQTALDYLDAVGLSLNPALDTALRVSGISGAPDEPAPGYLRWGGPVAGAMAVAGRGLEAATGSNPIPVVDINRGPQRIEEAARRMLTGREVTVPLDVATERRMDELALRETGQPIGSNDASLAPYVRAKRAKNGPLWERARAEVELERGVQSLAGFVSQGIRPDAILTPEESRIREARAGALVSGDLVRALDTASEKSPNARVERVTLDAIMGAVATIRERTGQPIPKSVADRLAAPTNANIQWVSQEIYKWELEQEPLLRGYTSSGSPEQRRIQNDLAAMGQAGRGLNPEQIQGMIAANRAGAMAQGKEKGVISAAMDIPGQERAAIIAENPLLVEYLAWKRVNPGREVEDFLREK